MYPETEEEFEQFEEALKTKITFFEVKCCAYTKGTLFLPLSRFFQSIIRIYFLLQNA